MGTQYIEMYQSQTIIIILMMIELEHVVSALNSKIMKESRVRSHVMELDTNNSD